MQKFQTRISFVEALRWQGQQELSTENAPIQDVIIQRDARTFVVTPEGRREIRVGDWLLKDSAGAFMTMSDEMFRQKYEPVKLPCPAI